MTKFFVPIRILFIASLLFVTSIVIVGDRTAYAADKQSEPVVRVSASGSAQLIPDMAILNLGVVRNAKTARAALDANSGAMREIIAELTKADIDKKDIQTSNFRIQLHRKSSKSIISPSDGPQIIGYTVSNNLSVTIRDIKSLGGILDQLVDLGINSGGNIRFTNDDPSDAITLARTRAVKNAIAKAKTLTAAMGAKLGRVQSISETTATARPVSAGQFRTQAAGGVPLASGQNTYQINVDISWTIDQ